MSSRPAPFDALAVLAKIRDELRMLRGEVGALREALDRHHRQQATDDPVTMAALLQTVSTTCGQRERAFTCADLIDHATLPTATELRAVLMALDSEMTPRKLGKLLRRISGRTFAGLRIERVGEGRTGALWVLRVCEFRSRKLALRLPLVRQA